MSQISPGPWCYKGQNSGLFEPQFRKYYSVYSICTAPVPNMQGDTVLENVAENCTEEDARAIAAIPKLVEALKYCLVELGDREKAFHVPYETDEAISKAQAALQAVKG